jgi:hypothetical protein
LLSQKLFYRYRHGKRIAEVMKRSHVNPTSREVLFKITGFTSD